jgi:hypothetical protein
MDSNEILIVGQIVGLAMRLDIKALEEFLDSPDKDKPDPFRYEKWCRAVITLRKALDQ